MYTITITPPADISLESALSMLRNLNFNIISTYTGTAKKQAKQQEEQYVSELIAEARIEFKEQKTTKINPLDIWANLSIQ